MWENVISGIPQGSVLGPLMFVIYINDLPSAVSNSNLYLFVDDTKLFKEEDCIELQQDLNNMQGWTNTSLLEFHPAKCKQMRIGNSDKPTKQYTLGLGDTLTPLTKSIQEKDIGVIIDSKLTFEHHIAAKINKANSILGTINKTFEYKDRIIMTTLYKSLVRPHLEYANQIWAPHLVKHVTALENVQHRATKAIPGLKDLEYNQRLSVLKLPTLSYRRLRGDMIETYKILTGKYDKDVTEGFFKLRQDSDTRGHSLKIFKERPRLESRKHSFAFRVADPWNSLTEDIVQAPSVASFERRLDKHWRNHPLMYNYRAPPTLDHAQSTPLLINSSNINIYCELALEAQ